MIFEPLKQTDKCNREIILRSADIADAEDLVQYLKTTATETPYLIREPEEVTITIEQERAFIKNKIAAERELMLIATVDGKHIGNCSLMSIGNYKRYAHRCEIAIALYQEYCGCGIGKIMLETVLDVARKVCYEQAELEVVVENKTAVACYKKMGFQEYGRFPNNMKYTNGEYADTYWMMKKL